MYAAYTYFHGPAVQSGPLAVALVAWQLGSGLDEVLAKVRAFPARGATAEHLAQAAGEFGLLARVVHCDIGDLRHLPLPAVLRGGRDQFLVLERVARGRYTIFDPQKGREVVDEAGVAARFSGVAIELTKSTPPKKRKERPSLHPLGLVTWSPDLTRGAVFAVGMAALVQVYVAVGPLYAGLVIDRAIPSDDRGLLVFLTFAFAMLALFNAGMSFLRGVAIQQLGTILGWNISRKVFGRLIRLPLDWFQSRQQADILQKLSSVDHVRQLLTTITTAVAVDGLVVLVSFVMITILAPLLGLLSAALLAAYVVLRAVAIPILQQRQTRAIQANVADSGSRMELVRSIQTIKAMAGEGAKEAVWSQKFAGSLQASLDSSVANHFFSAIQTAVMLISGLVIYFVGAQAVMAGDLTLGTLIAAIAYQGQFSQRATFLFEQYMSWRATDVHMARIADIALSEPEPRIDEPLGDISIIQGQLELKSVAYRYSSSENPIFSSVTFRIQPGEFVAITGPSGAGKSTLVKVLTGLYAPTEGRVLLDGRPLHAWGPRTVRTALGLVLQADEILSGTVADNVTFFAAKCDADLLWKSLTEAGMADEVAKMPMGEHTWVGDMGGALSGGQKQRLLLARALYKQPRLLVLDEATSHLDVPREQQILTMLRAQRKTVIMIAHRPETIAAADRVIHLEAGVCAPVEPRTGQKLESVS